MKNNIFKIINIFLILSLIHILGCKRKKPNTPETPTGPASGYINQNYTFMSSATNPYGDSVSIRFDWGNGYISDWSYYVENDDLVSMSYSWSDTGTYYVKVQAKDMNDATSSWSNGHQIKIMLLTSCWTKIYGGSGDDFGYSVEQTLDGGYIIAGKTNSFGAGNEDIYIIKTDTSGDTVWTKTYGGNDRDEGYSCRQTSDGGYIIVGLTSSFGIGYYSDVYLIRTNAKGDIIWTKTHGGSGTDDGCSVQQTSDGGYIIAGTTSSFGAGHADVYLIKTDTNGDMAWAKTYGGSNGDFGTSVVQISDGSYIITGYTYSFGTGNSYPDIYLIKTDANGDTVWTKTYGGNYLDAGFSVQQTSDEGYIIVGWTTSFGAGGDVYLIKTNANGDPMWTKTFGGSGSEYAYSVQQTSDEGYAITGSTFSFDSGGGDVYLIRTNVNGDTIWTKTYGGSLLDWGYSVQQTSDEGYIITGNTYSFGADERDIYLIKTNANGNTLPPNTSKMTSSISTTHSYLSTVKENKINNRRSKIPFDLRLKR